MNLATIAFQPEAYDSAATTLRQLQGFTVTVQPRVVSSFEPFDAELHDVIVGDDGQYKVVLRPWDDSTDAPGRRVVMLDIYDDIARLEVL